MGENNVRSHLIQYGGEYRRIFLPQCIGLSVSRPLYTVRQHFRLYKWNWIDGGAAGNVSDAIGISVMLYQRGGDGKWGRKHI